VGKTNPSPNTSGTSGQLFGDVLRQARRASSLTQAELGERANLSIRGLSDLERGINRQPRRETLLALADALGLGDEDRRSFFAAARRQSSLPAVSSSPQSSSSPEPEPVPPMTDTEPAEHLARQPDAAG
jgi:transcriptional regulator with XRE-family HTH domain